MSTNELSNEEMLYLQYEQAKNKQFQFIYEVLSVELDKREDIIREEYFSEDLGNYIWSSPSIEKTLFQVLIMTLFDYGYSIEDLCAEIVSWTTGEITDFEYIKTVDLDELTTQTYIQGVGDYRDYSKLRVDFDKAYFLNSRGMDIRNMDWSEIDN